MSSARPPLVSTTVPVPHRVQHRDYAFLGLTQSLCPECREVVPAKIITRGQRVYFRKTCPTHGMREDYICSDVSRYDLVETSLPAKLPAKTFVEPQRGCPYDCGLCSEHEQHTCIGVVEITDGCNLTCPMCYAASAPGKHHKSLEQIQAAIDRLVEAEGHAEVAQLSGGEPTLHPQLLDAVAYALDQPIDYVMINTNGIRLANDHELVSALAQYRERLEIYFQFDSLHDFEVAQLRGQTGLVEIKLRALKNLADAGLNVTLVATLQGGVNDTAPADLVQFAKSHPHVTGLSFQPATYSGRHVLPSHLEQRITFPDVIDGIAADPRNGYQTDDFFPLPCAHPNCHWISLAMRQGEELLPLTQFIDARANLDLLANGISFTREKTQYLAQQLAARLACGDGGCCRPASKSASELPVLGTVCNQGTEASQIEQFLQDAVASAVGARDMLRITITSFLDVYNFDVRRVMKCCTHHVLPSGHIVPFCAYNVLYRDGTAKLPALTS
ncbi:MAG: radical SAM protein [Pirellulaceae bacterium]